MTKDDRVHWKVGWYIDQIVRDGAKTGATPRIEKIAGAVCSSTPLYSCLMARSSHDPSLSMSHIALLNLLYI